MITHAVRAILAASATVILFRAFCSAARRTSRQADRGFDRDASRKIARHGSTTAVRREAVAHLRSVFPMSERRACTLVAADRKMVRYRSRRPPDTELRAHLRDIANQRRRFGYRRLFILLRRESEPSSINRIYRLYREEGLIVRKRKARHKAVGTRAPILVEARPNARCSLDLVVARFFRHI